MSQEKTKMELRKIVIGIGTIPLGIIFLLGIIFPEGFVKLMWGIVDILCENLGWLVSLGVIFSILITIYFLFSKYGNIKLGGPNAKPEFTTFSWWAISLCAGMGMGIVMFPPAEAIEYAFRPPVGMFLEPGSQTASFWAGQVTMMHWTIALYGVYVAAGLICAYCYYNLKQPFSVTSTLYPLMGKKAYKYSNIIDGITVFAIVGGVAGSLGYGILQVSDGIYQIFGIKVGVTSWIIVTIVTVAIYTLSSVSGLKKGIQWLGNKNAILFIGMLGFVTIFGPTKFSLNWGTRVLGGMFENLLSNIAFTDPFTTDKWAQWWNWLWFIDFFIFAPTTGLFLARLSKGRTIKEFITVNMVAPSIFGAVWCMLFGGLAAHTQWIKDINVFNIILEHGTESVMLRLFEQLPLPMITKPLMLVIVLISFITLANAVTSTIAKMSIVSNETAETEGDNDDAPGSIQVFWGVFMGAIALLFLLSGGLDGGKVIKLVVGFPILIFQIIVGIGFVKMFMKKQNAEKFREVEDEIMYENENMIK